MPKLRLSDPVLFVWILLGFNALAIGFYFSGVYGLQQIIAPTMDVLRPFQWREFGLLEFVQHGLLLVIIWILFKSAVSRKNVVEQVLLVGAGVAFVFLFLEVWIVWLVPYLSPAVSVFLSLLAAPTQFSSRRS